nr:Acetyltransferase (GNAT) family protein [Candidatus Prometheoarchaeum syntrophicum]
MSLFNFLENFIYFNKMLSMIRASFSLMDEIREIINSNYHMYEKILLIQEDHNEHFVNEQWAEQNFPIREFYLARDNGEYVGMASYQNLGNFAYIGYFYIKFGFHRKGYGRRIMQFLEMKAKSEQLNEIRLFVNDSADWAENAYKSMGFQEKSSNKTEILLMNQGILSKYYEEGQTLLVKTLSPLKPANLINNSFSMEE